MPTIGETSVETGELSALPAGPILIRLRRVLITTAIAAVVYTILSTGSAGSCSNAGGEVGTGEAVQTTCANLVLRPSWIVYAAFGVILFVAIGRIARRSSTVADALRILDRAATAIVIIALVCGVIGLVWMMLVPMSALTSGGTVVFPFPFSAPELTITHQP
ncbi:hypothetical protein AB4Z18_03145 [Leifsonia sp. 2TAF2]|uniref:hypothetical protein n=1 Tax=Leifsonia sp. 2TAF2 TaxID=3233009 RepID=UPI003F9AF58D